MKALLVAPVLALALVGCSWQQVSESTPVTQPVVDPVRGETSDCNLDDKYQWLLSQGRNVEMVSIDEWWSEDWRGYFAFTENNDVHCDQAINGGDVVTRFRGGVEENMDMEEFMSGVVGTKFIADYDER